MQTLAHPIAAADVNALLPQTQCTQCGYAGCAPYAAAIAAGAADINQCPPGGARGIDRLAALTGLPVRPLNPANGFEQALRVAFIDEALCIGCTLCIQACPVDAIVGAAKRMTTVVAELCTGCDLCVAPCPMDCIAMLPVVPTRSWSDADAAAARNRYEAREIRLSRERAASDASSKNRRVRAIAPNAVLDVNADERKRAAIAAAVERAREKRAGATRR